MAVVKLSEKDFEPCVANSNGNTRFIPNVEIKIVRLEKDPADPKKLKTMKWGRGTAPVVTIFMDGKEHQVGLPMITNCVIEKDGILHNEGDAAMKCVEVVGQRLTELLKVHFPTGDITLPESFMVTQRVKRAWDTKLITRKDGFTPSYLESMGVKTFEAHVEKSDGFIPQAYLAEDGSTIPAYTYIMVAPIIPSAKVAPVETATQKKDEKQENRIINRMRKLIKGNSFEMIAINGGTFVMGNNEINKEFIEHIVSVDSFYMGITVVTQALWKCIMGNNPSKHIGNNLPIENISWEEIQIFIKNLNHQTGLIYRLPTEAEWEYAAGGGSNNRTEYAGTNDKNEIRKYLWHEDYDGNLTHPVGQKSPNSLGLYDMLGNVFEFCSDFYSEFTSEPQTNPKGPTFEKYKLQDWTIPGFPKKVYKGNDWDMEEYGYMYSIYLRGGWDTSYGCNKIGFRLVCDPR